MRYLVLAAGLAALLVSLATTASADVTVEMKQDGKSQLMYAAEHKLSAPTDVGTMIFRGDKKVLWMVSRSDTTYREMTEQDLKKMGEKVSEARAQMEEALKNLPPEQREMAEKMMAERMPPSMMGGETEKVVKPLGQNRTINGFKTAGYEIYRDGVLEEEIWAADPEELGLSPEDFNVFQELGDFMQTVVPGMEGMFDRYTKNYAEPEEDEVPGFPVLTIRRNGDGTESWRSELVRIEKGTIPAKTFEVPEGFKKTAMDFGM